MRIINNVRPSGVRIFWGIVALLVFCPIYAWSQVNWVTDFDKALNQASEEEKLIVLDISASW